MKSFSTSSAKDHLVFSKMERYLTYSVFFLKYPYLSFVNDYWLVSNMYALSSLIPNKYEDFQKINYLILIF